MHLYLDHHFYSGMAEIPGITETNAATKLSRMKHILVWEFEIRNIVMDRDDLRNPGVRTTRDWKRAWCSIFIS